MGKRNFKKHTIEVTVLEEFSGVELISMSLGEIAAEMHAGRFVGTWDVKKSEDLDSEEMSEALDVAGSEPEAFDILVNDDD